MHSEALTKTASVVVIDDFLFILSLIHDIHVRRKNNVRSVHFPWPTLS